MAHVVRELKDLSPSKSEYGALYPHLPKFSFVDVEALPHNSQQLIDQDGYF